MKSSENESQHLLLNWSWFNLLSFSRVHNLRSWEVHPGAWLCTSGCVLISSWSETCVCVICKPCFLLNNRRTRTVAWTMEATFSKILPGRTPYANEIPPCILSDSSHWMVYSWLQSQLKNERPLHFRCLLLNELFSFMWLMEKESTFGYLKCKKLSPVKCISNLHCSNRVVVTVVVWGRTGDTALRTS